MAPTASYVESTISWPQRPRTTAQGPFAPDRPMTNEECRNPNEERMSKARMRKRLTLADGPDFGIWSFVIDSSFDIRHS